MTRIIGGSVGGRRLATPPGTATRPTSDRVREALFSSLEATFGPFAGLRFLDLYAGSGAIGLEALSRGAEAATLVESDREAAALIASNARTLGFLSAQVLAAPVASTLARPAAAAYDVVFSDPPYPLGEEELGADLAALAGHGWLAPDALVVVERSRRSPQPAFPAGFVEVRSRKYGETILWSAHAPVAAPTAPPPAPEAGEQ